jgi:hypothetical protein
MTIDRMDVEMDVMSNEGRSPAQSATALPKVMAAATAGNRELIELLRPVIHQVIDEREALAQRIGGY